MSIFQPPSGPLPNLTAFETEIETSAHIDDIEALYDQSFGPGRYAKTAERLREGNRLLRTCSRVCYRDGDLASAVRLWPLRIGETGRAVFVGPVAVSPKYRGSGLGLSLTLECLETAKEEGWLLAILVGDEPYFGRIGFKPISLQTFPMPGPVPAHRYLAKELDTDALEGLSGRVTVPR